MRSTLQHVYLDIIFIIKELRRDFCTSQTNSSSHVSSEEYMKQNKVRCRRHEKVRTVAVWIEIWFESSVQTRMMFSKLNFQMGLKTLVGLVRGFSTKYGNN